MPLPVSIPTKWPESSRHPANEIFVKKRSRVTGEYMRNATVLRNTTEFVIKFRTSTSNMHMIITFSIMFHYPACRCLPVRRSLITDERSGVLACEGVYIFEGRISRSPRKVSKGGGLWKSRGGVIPGHTVSLILVLTGYYIVYSTWHRICHCTMAFQMCILHVCSSLLMTVPFVAAFLGHKSSVLRTTGKKVGEFSRLALSLIIRTDSVTDRSIDSSQFRATKFWTSCVCTRSTNTFSYGPQIVNCDSVSSVQFYFILNFVQLGSAHCNTMLPEFDKDVGLSSEGIKQARSSVIKLQKHTKEKLFSDKSTRRISVLTGDVYAFTVGAAEDDSSCACSFLKNFLATTPPCLYIWTRIRHIKIIHIWLYKSDQRPKRKMINNNDEFFFGNKSEKQSKFPQQ